MAASGEAFTFPPTIKIIAAESLNFFLCFK